MKVAVLGAGFSGMLAAYLLEKEGIEVTVYEKQSDIGGHCKSFSSKNDYTELGTVFSFTKKIKELLIELQVDYSERFIYRNFVDENFKQVEYLSRENTAQLMIELKQLESILNTYSSSFKTIDYGYIHEELLISLCKFLRKHKLMTICKIIAPLLSAFGFGNVCTLQAYYAFKVFDLETIRSFILSNKLIVFNKGTSEIIQKLSQNITDIRYSLEVINVEGSHEKVKVETAYGSDFYDKVLITTKLPSNVIKDDLYNELMKKIDTNPFITCAYEVSNKDLVTTYFKSNLGATGKIQFFYTSRQNHRTTLVAYAYGTVQKDVINGITEDIQKTGIDVKHLITTKQWYIFPHLETHNLTSSFYMDINEKQKSSNIHLIGSLVSKPEISNLYVSVKHSVEEIIATSKNN